MTTPQEYDDLVMRLDDYEDTGLNDCVTEAEMLCTEAAAAITALSEKNAKLMARLERDHAYRLVDGKMVRVEMELTDHTDGIACRNATISCLQDDITALRAERDAAVEALQPFAEEACVWDDKVPDTFMPESIGTYTIGDLRRAYRIVASKKEEV